MTHDHPSNGEGDNRNPFGDLAEDILSQISSQIEKELDPETIEIMKERVEELEGPQLAAFILGKFFGQLAITENEPRMFYASIACLWFSSVFVGFSDASSSAELMVLAEKCWEDAQRSIQDVISESVEKFIEEI